jgi:SAM-dependent methyltransferase
MIEKYLAQWDPPSLSDFDSEITHIFSRNKLNQVGDLARYIFYKIPTDLLRNGFGGLHGELRGLFSFPFSRTIYEHYVHLRFLESLFNQKKLNILDMGCGSAEFSYIASELGHTVLSQDAMDPDLLDRSQSDQMSIVKEKRALMIRILSEKYLNKKIKPNKPIFLEENQFDVIYINGCTLHQGDGGAIRGFWNGGDWFLFLNHLRKQLRPEGIIFITLAHPTYYRLSKYLSQFAINYKEYFPHTNMWDCLIVSEKDKDKVSNIDLALSAECSKSYFDISQKKQIHPANYHGKIMMPVIEREKELVQSYFQRQGWRVKQMDL